MKIEQIIVTVIISALILGVQHWGIAQVAKKQFHPLVNYTLGVLAMFIPLAVLFNGWGSQDELIALVAVIVGSGVAVAFAYSADGMGTWVRAAMQEKQGRLDAEEREQAAIDGLRQSIGMDDHAKN
jgi:hypothetical protein